MASLFGALAGRGSRAVQDATAHVVNMDALKAGSKGDVKDLFAMQRFNPNEVSREMVQNNMSVVSKAHSSGMYQGLNSMLGIKTGADVAPAGRRTTQDIAQTFAARKAATGQAINTAGEDIVKMNQLRDEFIANNDMDGAKRVADAIAFSQKQNGRLLGRAAGERIGETAAYVGRGVQSAFEGGAGQVARKVGIGGAAWMGANTVARGVSGGGATYNNSGQRDIAGIPFF